LLKYVKNIYKTIEGVSTFTIKVVSSSTGKPVSGKRVRIGQGDKEIMLTCEVKGETRDCWINRNLRIEKQDFDKLMKDYEGKFGFDNIMEVWERLLQNFIRLEEV